MPVTLRNGDTLKFAITFDHKGAAAPGTIHVALAQKGIAGYDEKLFVDVPFTTDPDPTVHNYAGQASIVIKNIGTTGFGPGKYEAYAKITGIPGSDVFWYGLVDDIILEADAAVFSNLQVTYSKA